MNEIDEDDDELNPSPQIQSIVPMCDDYEDEHWNPLGAFYGGQVYFPYIPKTYVLGKVFEVNFAIFNKVRQFILINYACAFALCRSESCLLYQVHPLAGDWIGLFKDGCRSLGQYVAYQNVPELCGKRWFPIEMSVSFSSEDLPVRLYFYCTIKTILSS